MKLACRWPDYRSPYADLLGLLTTLGDVEALGFQWQGQKDKTHNADRLLKQVRLSVVSKSHIDPLSCINHPLCVCLADLVKRSDSLHFMIMQAADRFMHMLEDHDGPEHLVVFITSDQDFGEKILELQRRNFKVVVLYHEPHASQRPVSIINVADEAHDWLPFLRRELSMPQLSISDYDAKACQPGKVSPFVASPTAKTEAVQKLSPDRSNVKVICHVFDCLQQARCACYQDWLHFLLAQHCVHSAFSVRGTSAAEAHCHANVSRRLECPVLLLNQV